MRTITVMLSTEFSSGVVAKLDNAMDAHLLASTLLTAFRSVGIDVEVAISMDSFDLKKILEAEYGDESASTDS